MSEKIKCESCGLFKTKKVIENHRKICNPIYCAYCGQLIIGKDRRKKFCNIECALKFREVVPITINCGYCGKEITTTDYKKKFCSRSCSVSVTNKNKDRDKINKKISESLKEFYSDEENLEIIKKMKEASLTPEAIQKRTNTLKTNLYKLENWEKFGPDARKNYLFDLQKGICAECGNSEHNGKPIPLEVHHIDGNRNNNGIENCVLLCANCHANTPNYKGKAIGITGKYNDIQVAEVLRKSSTIRQALIKLGFAPKGKNYNRFYRVINEFNIMPLKEKYSKQIETLF